MGVAAISMSNFSHTLDISQTDFEQRGHASYSKIQFINIKDFQTIQKVRLKKVNWILWILTGNALASPLSSSCEWYGMSTSMTITSCLDSNKSSACRYAPNTYCLATFFIFHFLFQFPENLMNLANRSQKIFSETTRFPENTIMIVFTKKWKTCVFLNFNFYCQRKKENKK